MSHLLVEAAEKSQNRYRDGYRLARIIDFWGFVLKIIAFVLGIAITLIGAGIASQASRYAGGITDGGAFFAGAIVGVPVAVIVWVLGVVVQAHGQFMKASLDGAVCGNVFLSHERKAAVMFPSLAADAR
jgi:hypothetical protein